MDRESEVKDGHQIPALFHRGLDCYVMNDNTMQCSVVSRYRISGCFFQLSFSI